VQKLSVLNTREKKKIIDKLGELYGFSGEIKQALLMNKDHKIFLLSPDIAMLEKKQENELRIDAAGLYIGKVEPEGIRLSIEGSQIIGPYSKKHVLEIDDNHLEPWVRGESFELSNAENKKINSEQGFFIIKHGNDFLGGAQIKNNVVKSLVSKERRLKVLNK